MCMCCAQPTTVHSPCNISVTQGCNPSAASIHCSAADAFADRVPDAGPVPETHLAAWSWSLTLLAVLQPCWWCCECGRAREMQVVLQRQALVLAAHCRCYCCWHHQYHQQCGASAALCAAQRPGGALQAAAAGSRRSVRTCIDDGKPGAACIHDLTACTCEQQQRQQQRDDMQPADWLPCSPIESWDTSSGDAIRPSAVLHTPAEPPAADAAGVWAACLLLRLSGVAGTASWSGSSCAMSEPVGQQRGDASILSVVGMESRLTQHTLQGHEQDTFRETINRALASSHHGSGTAVTCAVLAAAAAAPLGCLPLVLAACTGQDDVHDTALSHLLQQLFGQLHAAAELALRRGQGVTGL